VTAL